MTIQNLTTFINYRRADTKQMALLLHRALGKALENPNSIFLDTESIDYGSHFPSEIEYALQQVTVVLVLIGENWLKLENSTGEKRLFVLDDWVRREIEIGLTLKKITIPVLVDNAEMPNEDDLPRSIRQIATLNAAQLRSGSDFQSDIDRLSKNIRSHIDTTTTIKPEPQTRTNITWTGSPFPGLRSFTPAEQPIFFGRDRETASLVHKVKANRFVVVVGASGSGKSSLVGAGLVPRLESKDWLLPSWRENERIGKLKLTPGNRPLDAIYTSLIRAFPTMRPDDQPVAKHKKMYIETFMEDEASLAEEIQERVYALGQSYKKVLLFVDQFEELFTLAEQDQRQPFIDLLLYPTEILHIVLTMRADFQQDALAVEPLVRALNEGQMNLGRPSTVSLHTMIALPASSTGLTFETGLPEKIVADTGDEPGNLALMAFTLDELYRRCKDKNIIEFDDYNTLNGVEGAIGVRAASIYSNLLDGIDVEQLDANLGLVFRNLIEIRDNTPIRRRAHRESVVTDELTEELVDSLLGQDARLLVASGDDMLEVAHEALFRAWKPLKTWIENHTSDLILRNEVETDAARWLASGKDENYLWNHERLVRVHEMMKRIAPDWNHSLIEFIRSEPERIRDKLANANLPRYEVQRLLARLKQIEADPVMLQISNLYSTDTEDILSAMYALRETRDLRAVPHLIQILESDQEVIVEAAIRVIFEISELDSVDMIDALLKLLNHENLFVRCTLIQALGEVDLLQARDRILESLDDGNSLIRRYAVFAVGTIEFLEPANIVRMLQDSDTEVCKTALLTLSNYSSDNMMIHLEKLSEHEDVVIRDHALQILNTLNNKN